MSAPGPGPRRGSTIRRTLAVVAFLYLVEGLPMGLFRDVWPVYFRDHGTSLAAIGAISGLYLAWSLKFLWSPALDQYVGKSATDLYGRTRKGRR